MSTTSSTTTSTTSSTTGTGSTVSTATTACTATTTTAPNTSYVLFRNVTVPQNVLITKAHIYLTAFETSESEPVYSNIVIAVEDNPSAPTSKSDLDDRPVSTAAVRWDHIDSWDDNKIYKSPNIKELIQEIVDRDTWVSGNNMLLMIKALEEAGHTGERYRWWSAIEHLLGAQRAKLVIFWRKPRQVLTPAIEPIETFYLESPLSVSISTWPTDADIFYTVDGSTPDENDTLYTGEFDISGSITVKAIAQKQYWLDSEVAEKTYQYYEFQPLTEYEILPSLYFINESGVSPYYKYSVLDHVLYGGKLYILANIRKYTSQEYPEILIMINGTPGLDDWAYETVFDPSIEIITPTPTDERFRSANLTMGDDGNWHVSLMVALGYATNYWAYKKKSGGVWQTHIKVPYSWFYGIGNDWPIYVNASGYVYWPGVEQSLDVIQLRMNPSFNWATIGYGIDLISDQNQKSVWMGNDWFQTFNAFIPPDDPYRSFGWFGCYSINGPVTFEKIENAIPPSNEYNYDSEVGFMADQTPIMHQSVGSYYQGSGETDWYITSPRYRHGTNDWRNWFNQNVIASGSLSEAMSRYKYKFPLPQKTSELALLYFQTFDNGDKSFLRVIRGVKGSTAEVKIWRENTEPPVPNIHGLNCFVYNDKIYLLFSEDSNLLLLEEKVA